MAENPVASLSDASEKALVDHLQSLNLGGTTLQRDEYLTMEAINKTFDDLPRIFLDVQAAFSRRGSERFIYPSWELLKAGVVTNLCDPYRKVVAGLKSEHAAAVAGLKSERATEVARLESERATEVARLELERGAVVSRFELERGALVAGFDFERAAFAQKDALKSAEISGLIADILSRDLKITQLAAKTIKQREKLDCLKSEVHDLKSLLESEMKHLKSRVDTLQDTCDYYKDEALRLTTENLHLKSQKQYPDGVPATGTRTKTWEDVMADKNNLLDQVLPVTDHPIIDEEVDDLATTTFVKEPTMYDRVKACLAAHLTTKAQNQCPGSQVFDTHSLEVISGLKPDMSIVTQSHSSPTVVGMIAVVELKVGSLSKASFGQLYDYLKGIKHAQPNRRIIIGLLSNLVENQFLVLECHSEHRTRCVRYQSVSLTVAISYLREVVISNPQYHPQASVFAADLGPLQGRLGNPAFSVLGVFDIPEIITTTPFKKNRWVNESFKLPHGIVQMVVKRTTPAVYGMTCPSRAPRSVEHEIRILQRIHRMKKDTDDGWKNLPQILYRTKDYNEFGMLPRGYPIRVSDGGMNWGKVLTDVLDALKWLHDRHIVHRDVRLDNIVWDVTHAVLIDLGAAIDISAKKTPVEYSGGYVCCPPAIIGKFDDQYLPKPADDCLSVVLLVNSVLFPARWETFRSVELEKPGSPETRDLGEFWIKLERSVIWGPFYRAACKAEHKVLKGMVEFFVYMR